MFGWVLTLPGAGLTAGLLFALVSGAPKALPDSLTHSVLYSPPLPPSPPS